MKTVTQIAPAPGGLPVLGHALRLLRDPRDFLSSLPAHGDVVRIGVGPWKALVICDPELLREVLVNDRVFDKGGTLIDRGRETLGNGIAHCPHSDHREQRRLLQPAFHRSQMARYTEVMALEIGTVMDGWRDGLTIDVLAEMTAVSTRVVSRTVFSSEAAVEAAKIVGEAADEFVRSMFRQTIMPPLINKLPTPANRRYQAAVARMHEAAARATEQYRRDGIDHGDILSVLLAARGDNGKPQSDAQIRAQVITLLLGGIDTTAVTLAWALHVLAQDGRLRARVAAEADAVLGGRLATWDDLPRLELTGRVITEVLRMYSPLWLLTRTVTEDVTLGGHRIRQGTMIMYSPYIIHHRRDLYPDPDRFDPDRWLPDRSGQRSRTAVVPFGGGARKCIGDQFGMNEAMITLASIAARWTLTKPPAAAVVSVKTDLFLAPKNLFLRAERRTGAAPVPALPTRDQNRWMGSSGRRRATDEAGQHLHAPNHPAPEPPI